MALPPSAEIESIEDLLHICGLLIGDHATDLSDDERELLSLPHRIDDYQAGLLADEVLLQLVGGGDPLGDAYESLVAPAARRDRGQVYTPATIVQPMVDWVLTQKPSRVVDAGCGSGRYAAAVVRQDPTVAVIAIDADPVATLMTRAALRALGAQDFEVRLADFTALDLGTVPGPTAYIGNPPYVRHHRLPATTKQWARAAASKLGHEVSGLAGLHAYFYLAVAGQAQAGDFGVFVTSAEWLDVNYGSIVRELLLGRLDGVAIDVVDPTAMPFGKTATTAALVRFAVDSPQQGISFSMHKDTQSLTPLPRATKPVSVARLSDAGRWSVFIRSPRAVPAGYVELGEIARVHRGAVTGANASFVHEKRLSLPDAVQYPSVTRARELFDAGFNLESSDHLKIVVDIPPDLDVFDSDERRLVNAFLRSAKARSAHLGYVTSHRRAWWSVGLKQPAVILATYMARRPPAFVINGADARHINIAHGLYPRISLSDHQVRELARSLNKTVTLADGRTYAGGLTKFEPREMERLLVPHPDQLASHG